MTRVIDTEEPAEGTSSLPGDGASTPILELDCASYSYGLVQVLFDVSLSIARHERVALLGTNGAGKSTLLNIIAGLVTPSTGMVRFEQRDITDSAPHKRAELGIMLVPGGKATFPTLSVEENLRLAAYPFMGERELVAARIDMTLERLPALRRMLPQRAGTLSGGEQQLMALARALIARPQVLLVDELSLGLAPVVMQDIVSLVEEIAGLGTTLVIVEQSLNVAATITDRAYFMEKGQIRFSGPTSKLLERGDLARSVFFGDTG